MEQKYLDWAATSLPDPDILQKTTDCALRYFANPSSSHKHGKAAGNLLSECRERVAAALKVRSNQIIFTSGGTEANNLVIFQLLQKERSQNLLVPTFEHPSLLEPVKYLKKRKHVVKYLNCEKNGTLSLSVFSKKISVPYDLIAVMAVQNEIGSIQPIKKLVELIRAQSGNNGKTCFFHTDAVQALGRVDLNLNAWGVDSASLSSHKIAGPRGVGALYLKKPIETLNKGGGQEFGLRSGTENLAGIYGFTLALEKRLSSLEQNYRKALKLKTALVNRLKGIKGIKLLPENQNLLSSDFSPYILALALPPVPGEVTVRRLGDNGWAVSSGSACFGLKKTGKRLPLAGLNISDDLAAASFRVSLDHSIEEKEIINFAKTLKSFVAI